MGRRAEQDLQLAAATTRFVRGCAFTARLAEGRGRTLVVTAPVLWALCLPERAFASGGFDSGFMGSVLLAPVAGLLILLVLAFFPLKLARGVKRTAQGVLAFIVSSPAGFLAYAFAVSLTWYFLLMTAVFLLVRRRGPASHVQPTLHPWLTRIDITMLSASFVPGLLLHRAAASL